MVESCQPPFCCFVTCIGRIFGHPFYLRDYPFSELPLLGDRGSLPIWQRCSPRVKTNSSQTYTIEECKLITSYDVWCKFISEHHCGLYFV